jgi:hypothetical protein
VLKNGGGGVAIGCIDREFEKVVELYCFVMRFAVTAAVQGRENFFRLLLGFEGYGYIWP